MSVSSTGGIDLTSLIPALVEARRAPLTTLSSQKAKADNAASAYQTLSTLLTSAKTAIAALATAADWSPLAATSSSSAVSVTAAAGGVPSSLTFTVDQRATAQSMYSTSTYAATTDTVMAAGTKLLIASGGRAFGLGTLVGGAALPTGAHSIAVTQASAGAVASGGTPLAAGTVVDASNDTLQLSVDGVATTVTLAHGTYATAADLADAVGDALAADPVGQGATASLSSGALRVTTTREGSAATLEITGGTALGALGLAVGPATTGTDGKITVDGTETTLSSVQAGDVVVLPAATGDVTATLTGGLRTGTLNARSVDVGDGSLGAVVAAINGASSGVTASAVQVSPGSYRLQLASGSTGATGGVNLDLSMFTGTGGWTTLSSGADAKITVTGDAPYSITSATNTFSEVMPGLGFTLQPGATGSVTVTTSRDVSALAKKVAAVVNGINTALNEIKTKTAYNSVTGTSGPLSGNGTVRFLRTNLTSALMDPVAGGTPPVASLAGVTLNKDGSLAFDTAKFTEAFNADPVGTQRLFTSMGSDAVDPGALERLTGRIEDATKFGTGSLVTLEQSQRDASTRMKTQMEEMNRRIDLYEAGLRSKFSILQSSLQNLQNQRSWLSTQISSMGMSTSLF